MILDATGVDIFAFSCLFFIVSYLLYIIYYAIGLYDLNPFLRPTPLSEREKHILRHHITGVKSLKESDRNRFYKRVAWFRAKKAFVYKARIENKNTIELLVSAAGVLLTLGLKNYKFVRSVHKIVVYPSDYYSVINKKRHLGEYNLGLKTLVFAADSVKEGFEINTDNLNLALHEFAHALYFETSGRSSWEALRFQWGFRKLTKVFNESIKDGIKVDDAFFRSYAATNVFEFFSVTIEHFFESPMELRSRFPEVHNLIFKMLNYEHH